MTDAKGTKRALITSSTVKSFQQTSGKTERQGEEERVNDVEMEASRGRSNLSSIVLHFLVFLSFLYI